MLHSGPGIPGHNSIGNRGLPFDFSPYQGPPGGKNKLKIIDEIFGYYI